MQGGTSSIATLTGLTREVWRIVPPVRSMVRTRSSVRRSVHSSSVPG
jgi:hypothetical protein